MWMVNEWQQFYCVLPFFGRKDARCRLEPFRDNVRFRCCGCFLFWEFWLSWTAWDSLLVIQSVTYWDVLFHQPQFVEVGLITSVFCDSTKLLFVSLPGDTGIFLNESVNPFYRESSVNYLVVPKVLVLGPISSVNSSSFDSIKFFFRLKLSSAENFFIKLNYFSKQNET